MHCNPTVFFQSNFSIFYFSLLNIIVCFSVFLFEPRQPVYNIINKYIKYITYTSILYF